MNIEVATFAEGDMGELCQLLYRSLESNKSNNHNIIYTCYTLDSTFAIKNFNVKFCPEYNLHKKLKHTYMIHQALKQCTSDVLVITDCDMGVFYHNWDELIVDELKENKIFGAEYGAGSLGYKKLPCGFFMAIVKDQIKKLDDENIFYPWFNDDNRKSEMEEYCKDHNVDFKIIAPLRMIRPYRLQIMTQKDSEIFNIPIGEQIGCDVGWKLPVYLKENNIKTSYMEGCVRFSKNANLYFLGRHWHNRVITEFKYKDQTFAVHFTKARGINRSASQAKNWKMMVSNYINNKGLNYRMMSEEDLPFFLSLRNQCIEFLHNKTIFSLEDCLQWYKSESPKYFIIEDLSRKIGYIRTSNETSSSMYIGVDLVPEYRNKGIGFWALNTIMLELRKKEYYLEVLESNIIAKKLYDKLGFKEIKRENGSILMMKDLK